MLRSLPAATAFSALAFAFPLAAQCANLALPSGGMPGTSGSVSASTMWDPDGAGPATARLVVAGLFHVAGTVVANNIAAWDPATSTWTSLGTGMNDSVSALAALPNGDLIATGSFTSAGGVTANRVARWNGTTWSPLGAGLGDFATALAAMPNGDVVVGGWFTQAGGVATNYIARWDGVTWTPLGTGMQGPVTSLLVLPNGDLLAGGHFTAAGGVAANKIASWNGSSWSGLGAGLGTALNTAVLDLATLPNGNVVAGGSFNLGAPGSRVALWNGSTWSALGAGTDENVFRLVALPNGDLLAGGAFSNAGGVAATRIARWNGAAWSPFGGATSAAYTTDSVSSLTLAASGELFVGGRFESIAGVGASNIARWSGSAWSALDVGLGPFVAAMLVMPNGDLVAAGGSTIFGYIARWNGTAWAPLGSGLDGPVTALTRLPNGDLVAAGDFTHAGGVAALRVARWDGTAWWPVGSGVSGFPPLAQVRALATMPNGDVVLGGSYLQATPGPFTTVVRWNGAVWSTLGLGLDGISDPIVEALTVMPNGDLVAGGWFASSGGGAPLNNIARWDGVTWSPLGSGVNSRVNALHVRPNGDLVAGGFITSAGGVAANHIARWDGAAWSALGPGVPPFVFALATHPNGDLLAGGYNPFTTGVPIYRLARWDGVLWSAIGSGVDDTVHAFATLPNGDVAIGGRFHLALDAVSPFFARLSTTCPALATSYGAGCTSSAGPVTLAATSLPWLGGTYRATTTGMPAISLALDVFGLTQVNIGLPAILPQGVAGCSLLASPDLLGTLVPAAGTVQSQLGVPNTAALVNQLIHHQVAALELGPTGITAVTSSNGLTLTLGSF